MPTVPVDESTLENIALSWFAELGYEARYGDEIAPGEPAAERDAFDQVTKLELEVPVKGLFEKRRHLEFLRNFMAFEEDPHSDALIKILAGYHQFHAVQQAVDASIKATGPAGDRRCGVVWHTQAPRSKRRTPTRGPCSAITSAFTTSSGRSRIRPPFRSTTKAGLPSWP